MTRIKQQLGSQQMALNGLVMKVNNLIERKNKREALAMEKAAAVAKSKTKTMIASQFSHFTGKSRHSKQNHKSKQAQELGSSVKPSPFNVIAKKRRVAEDDHAGLSMEVFGFGEKERTEQKLLEDIDQMYLIDENEDNELFTLQGLKKRQHKQKQAPQEEIAPFRSPYIVLEMRNQDEMESRDSSTVIENQDVDDTINPDSRGAGIDEGLYRDLDELDRRD